MGRSYYATAQEIAAGLAVEGWRVEWPGSYCGCSSPFLTRAEAEAVEAASKRRGRVVPVWLKCIHGQKVRFPGEVGVLRERVMRGLRVVEGGLVDGRPAHWSGFCYRMGIWYAAVKSQAEAEIWEPWEVVAEVGRCYVAPAQGANFQRLFEELQRAWVR